MSIGAYDQIVKLGRQFADAQQRGDVAALDEVLTDDFKLVGPLGFVLSREDWLEQHRSGALGVQSLEWDDVDVRSYDETAIAIGRQNQRAAYRGQPADGSFRVTQIAVRADDRWALAGLHFSQVAQPGSRPVGGGAR